jgi:hypothetical protein
MSLIDEMEQFYLGYFFPNLKGGKSEKKKMALFDNKPFKSKSGAILQWKVECDALTDEDWEWAAARIAERFTFCDVEGVPTGRQ